MTNSKLLLFSLGAILSTVSARADLDDLVLNRVMQDHSADISSGRFAVQQSKAAANSSSWSSSKNSGPINAAPVVQSAAATPAKPVLTLAQSTAAIAKAKAKSIPKAPVATHK